MSDVFGPIFSGSEVEQHVFDILKKWMETYIAEVQRQINWTGNKIPTPRSWTTRNTVDHFPEDQLPQCIVVSPGLSDPPKKRGDGTYHGEFMLAVAIVCSAKDEPSTKALARFYAAVVRSVLIQHPTLDNKAIGLTWYDESYDDIPDEDVHRNIASGTVYFRIEYEDIVTWQGGPRIPLPPISPGSPDPGEGRWPAPDPATQPGSQDPHANTVNITLVREAL